MTLGDASTHARMRRAVSVLAEMGYDVDLVSQSLSERMPACLRYPIQPWASTPTMSRANNTFRKLLYAFSALLPGSRIFRAALELRYGVQHLLSSVQVPYSVLVVEDIELLPIALDVQRSRGGEVIMDLRDFKWVWEREPLRVSFRDHHIYQRRLYRKYLPMASEIITVSAGQRQLLKAALNLDSCIVMSAPAYRPDLLPHEIDAGHIRLVYHGKADLERKLEVLIDAVMELDDRFRLDLFLVPSQRGVIDDLRRRASQCVRIRILDPIQHVLLVDETNSYDIAILLFPPINPNLATALPNKFFEAVQARLAVVVGPGSEMSNIVLQHGVGFVTEGYTAEALANCLRDLTFEALIEAKVATQAAAKTLSFENESETLKRLFAVSKSEVENA